MKTETEEQRERRLKRGREYAAKNAPTREQRMSYIRKWRYNVTDELWNQLFESQGRCCAICSSSKPQKGKGWSIDHNPVTHKVRGILCMKCNVAVGLLDDSTERFEAAIVYLRSTCVIDVTVNTKHTQDNYNRRGPKQVKS